MKVSGAAFAATVDAATPPAWCQNEEATEIELFMVLTSYHGLFREAQLPAAFEIRNRLGGSSGHPAFAPIRFSANNLDCSQLAAPITADRDDGRFTTG